MSIRSGHDSRVAVKINSHSVDEWEFNGNVNIHLLSDY